jgi:hypothetical protein
LCRNGVIVRPTRHWSLELEVWANHSPVYLLHSRRPWLACPSGSHQKVHFVSIAPPEGSDFLSREGTGFWGLIFNPSLFLAEIFLLEHWVKGPGGDEWVIAGSKVCSRPCLLSIKTDFWKRRWCYTILMNFFLIKKKNEQTELGIILHFCH